MGDFNVDLLKIDRSDYSNRFSEHSFTSSFFPLISKPTRMTQHSPILIDNIFTNDHEQIGLSQNRIIFTDISDHFPVFHFGNTSIQNQIKSDRKYKKIFDAKNVSSFSNTIKTTTWDDILQSNDANEPYETLLQKIKTAFNTHFPIQKISNKVADHFKSPWMTYR